MMRSLLFFFLITFLLAATLPAEPGAIFLVRHAERADTSAAPQKDPDLSAEGKARAKSLASTLCDAGITAIYTSEYKRTQETGAPLAHSLGIKSEVVPAKETATLIAQLKASDGNALVIGHSNTLPEIAKALSVSQPIRISETDYDDLFVIILGKSPPQLLHLHYR